jgi:hypothetical protein
MSQTRRCANVDGASIRLYALIIALAALMMLLAACGTQGTAAASSATATATCPPARSFKTVTGAISATGANVITVTSSNGSKTLVHLTTSTRITRIVAATPTDLTTGAIVQVTTDTAATAAQRIVIVPMGQGGFGGRGGGTGFGRGTPPAGFNSACFQRQGTPSGTGGPGGFQGLRGTVASATSTQLVLDDAQGQTFTVAITSATVILTSASGTASDLSVGLTVSASGTATSDGISARTITVQEAGAK